MQQPQISDLLTNPDFYLFGFENEHAVFVRMNRDCYAQSIFFDGRIVTLDDNAFRVPVAQLSAEISKAKSPLPHIGWIFHMAHTGSTLLARALDRPGNTLVIREPTTLRALGVEVGASANGTKVSERLGVALAMLDRRYSDNETMLVKANVPVNCIIPDILAGSLKPKALLLHFGFEDYLVAILRSPNHRKWVENIHSELRLGEHSRIGELQELEVAQKAATLWLFQIKVYADVLAEYPDVCSLDANFLFNEPTRCLKAASEYFDCPVNEEEARWIASGDLFSTYSKNPNAAFDNAHRKRRVAETRATMAGEISSARRWLESRIAETALPERLANPLCGENSLLF